MSEETNNNINHPPYEYALSLLVIQRDNAFAKKDDIADLWDYESVGEAEHLSLADAQEADVPMPDPQDLSGVFPFVLVYDHDLEDGYDNPIFMSDNLVKVRDFIRDFESNYEAK